MTTSAQDAYLRAIPAIANAKPWLGATSQPCKMQLQDVARNVREQAFARADGALQSARPRQGAGLP